MNRFLRRRQSQEDDALDRGQDAIDALGPLPQSSFAADPYNPEEGDVDETAPGAQGYDPELGDEPGNSRPTPAPRTLLSSFKPSSENPEEGAIQASAIEQNAASLAPAPRRPAQPRPAPLSGVGDPRGNALTSLPQHVTPAETSPDMTIYPGEANGGFINDLDAAVRVPALPAGQDPARPAPVQADQPPPSPVVARAQARPVSAASDQRQPAQTTKVDAGPKPPSQGESLLKQAPGLLANIFAAAKIGRGYQPVLEGIQDRVEHGRDLARQDDAARVSYGRRKNYLEREARKEAKADAKEQRLLNKQELAEKEAKAKAEHRNKTFRQAFQQAYPDVAAHMDPETLNSLTTEDAASVGLITAPVEAQRKADAKEAIHQKERGEKLEDLEKGEQIKKKYRKGAMSSYAEPMSPEQRAAEDKATIDSVNAQFGGEDKVPPALKRKLDLAMAIKNPKKRQEAVTKALDSAMSEGHKGKSEDARGETADLKERTAYANYTKGARDLEQTATELDEALGPAGDAPGVGPVENVVPGFVYGMGTMLPDSMGGDYSRKAQLVRQRAGQQLIASIREASGKATTDSERAYLKEVEGLAMGGTADNLREATRKLHQWYRNKMEDASRNFPAGAASYNDQPNVQPQPAPNAPAQAAPQQALPQPGPGVTPPPGMMLIRNKKTGEYRWAPQQ